MRTPEGFDQWCKDHPKDTGNPVGSQPPSSWDQKCVALVFRAGDFTNSFTSAYRAGVYTRNAHGLDTKIPLARVPRGWFVYFDKAGPDNGHIGMSMGGGNFLSANWRYSSHGTALGVGSIQGYIDTGAVYMGTSPYFGDATLDLTETEAGTPLDLDPAPIVIKRNGDADMLLIHKDNPDAATKAKYPHIFALFGPGFFQPFLDTDAGPVANGFAAQITGSTAGSVFVTADFWATVQRQAESGKVDYDTLAAAIAKALPAGTAGPSAAAIAKAVNDDAAARLAQ